MTYPLATGHKLPFHIIAECVAHTAVAACKPGSRSNGFYNIFTGFPIDFPHGPAGDNQILAHDKIQIQQYLLVVINGTGIAVFLHNTGEPLRYLIRFVAIPAPFEDQYLFSTCHLNAPFFPV